MLFFGQHQHIHFHALSNPFCFSTASEEEEAEQRETDLEGNVYLTVQELMQQEAARRAGGHWCKAGSLAGGHFFVLKMGTRGRGDQR